MNNNIPNNFNNGGGASGGAGNASNNISNPVVDNVNKQMMSGQGQGAVINPAGAMQGQSAVGINPGVMQGQQNVSMQGGVMQGQANRQEVQSDKVVVPGQVNSGINAYTMQYEAQTSNSGQVPNAPAGNGQRGSATAIGQVGSFQNNNMNLQGATSGVLSSSEGSLMGNKTNVVTGNNFGTPLAGDSKAPDNSQIKIPNSDNQFNSSAQDVRTNMPGSVGSNMATPTGDLSSNLPNNSFYNPPTSVVNNNVSSGGASTLTNQGNSTSTNNTSIGIKSAGVNQVGMSEVGAMEANQNSAVTDSNFANPPKKKFPLSIREMVLIGIALIGIVVVIIIYT